MVQNFDGSTQEAEADESIVQGQPGMHEKFQDSPGIHSKTPPLLKRSKYYVFN